LRDSSRAKNFISAEEEQRRRESRAPEAEKPHVFLSTLSASLLFLCADEILRFTIDSHEVK
jgi:hypothetical protein